MSIDLTRHSPDFATAGQLTPEQMADVARQGYRSVINNRPDGEGGPDQPTAAQMAAAAQAHSLAFASVPVVPSAISAADVQAFAEQLQKLPKPILAYCRSGARSTNLYRMALAMMQGGQG